LEENAQEEEAKKKYLYKGPKIPGMKVKGKLSKN